MEKASGEAARMVLNEPAGSANGRCKLPRTTKLFRGHLDAAPVLCVLFPLAFFAVLQHWLILPPGTELELPEDSGSISQAARGPAYIVGIDAAERLFENQLVEPASLASRLP